MRYVMFSYVSEEGAARYERQSETERTADREAHPRRFSEQAEKITGGTEFTRPRKVGRIRNGAKPVILDGPFAETKEVIGGLVELEAASLDGALAIAAGWPSLRLGAGASVEVVEATGR